MVEPKQAEKTASREDKPDDGKAADQERLLKKLAARKAVKKTKK